MVELTRNQWILIGIVVAVLVLGGLGWWAYTRAQVTMRGVQWHAGAGLGAPGMSGSMMKKYPQQQQPMMMMGANDDDDY